jgi:hypothetical protein
MDTAEVGQRIAANTREARLEPEWGDAYIKLIKRSLEETSAAWWIKHVNKFLPHGGTAALAGDERQVPTYCAVCGKKCPSAREAHDHCRAPKVQAQPKLAPALVPDKMTYDHTDLVGSPGQVAFAETIREKVRGPAMQEKIKEGLAGGGHNPITRKPWSAAEIEEFRALYERSLTETDAEWWTRNRQAWPRDQ